MGEVGVGVYIFVLRFLGRGSGGLLRGWWRWVLALGSGFGWGGVDWIGLVIYPPFLGGTGFVYYILLRMMGRWVGGMVFHGKGDVTYEFYTNDLRSRIGNFELQMDCLKCRWDIRDTCEIIESQCGKVKIMDETFETSPAASCHSAAFLAGRCFMYHATDATLGNDASMPRVVVTSCRLAELPYQCSCGC